MWNWDTPYWSKALVSKGERHCVIGEVRTGRGVRSFVVRQRVSFHMQKMQHSQQAGKIISMRWVVGVPEPASSAAEPVTEQGSCVTRGGTEALGKRQGSTPQMHAYWEATCGACQGGQFKQRAMMAFNISRKRLLGRNTECCGSRLRGGPSLGAAIVPPRTPPGFL